MRKIRFTEAQMIRMITAGDAGLISDLPLAHEPKEMLENEAAQENEAKQDGWCRASTFA